VSGSATVGAWGIESVNPGASWEDAALIGSRVGLASEDDLRAAGIHPECSRVRRHSSEWDVSAIIRDDRPVTEHGTHATYNNGCRCWLCGSFKSDYQAERYARRANIRGDADLQRENQ